MTATPQKATERALTVGQLAERVGTTVRTLHHYDEIGLVTPMERSAAGYRLYTDDDVTRLQQVVVYRRLGFALEEIALLLDDRDADVAEHLRRQRAAVASRLDEMTQLVAAIDRALERHMSGTQLTTEEQRELFGDHFAENADAYAREAEERWGETDAWKARARTARYTKADWEQIKGEADEVNAAFVRSMDAGLPASSPEAMDAAEQARRHIHDRFYDLTPDFHRNLGDLYVADPRFTETYEGIAPGLAQYVRDAIHANADRQAFTER